MTPLAEGGDGEMSPAEARKLAALRARWPGSARRDCCAWPPSSTGWLRADPPARRRAWQRRRAHAILLAMRRLLLAVGVCAAVGVLMGLGYAALTPPPFVAKALIVLPS